MQVAQECDHISDEGEGDLPSLAHLRPWFNKVEELALPFTGCIIPESRPCTWLMYLSSSNPAGVGSVSVCEGISLFLRVGQWQPHPSTSHLSCCGKDDGKMSCLPQH